MEGDRKMLNQTYRILRYSYSFIHVMSIFPYRAAINNKIELRELHIYIHTASDIKYDFVYYFLLFVTLFTYNWMKLKRVSLPLYPGNTTSNEFMLKNIGIT
jgi:hypothetical protein